MTEKEPILDKALKLLEKAIEQRRSELKHAFSSPSYSPLIKMFGLRTILSFKLLGNILKKSKEMTDENLVTLRREINEAPWTFLSKVGLIGIGLGVMLGSRYKRMERKKR